MTLVIKIFFTFCLHFFCLHQVRKSGCNHRNGALHRSNAPPWTTYRSRTATTGTTYTHKPPRTASLFTIVSVHLLSRQWSRCNWPYAFYRGYCSCSSCRSSGSHYGPKFLFSISPCASLLQVSPIIAKPYRTGAIFFCFITSCFMLHK